MADDSLSPEELEFLRRLHESSLHDYPNPERAGCLPVAEREAFLRKLAFDRTAVASRTQDIDHVMHCSPCYREFTALRDQAQKTTWQTAAVPKSVVPRLWKVVAAGALLVILVMAGLRIWDPGERDPGGQVQTNPSQTSPQPDGITPGVPASPQYQAVLDMRDRPVSRGEGTQAAPALALQRGLVNLTVHLPIGLEPGNYEVRLVRDLNSTPVFVASEQARYQDQKVSLQLRMDLSKADPGRYMLFVGGPDTLLLERRVVIQ
jgi:hypothetical protein